MSFNELPTPGAVISDRPHCVLLRESKVGAIVNREVGGWGGGPS